jgi:hypothetical protein
VGKLFMKNEDADYYGPETEAVEPEWNRKFQPKKRPIGLSLKVVIWKWAIQDLNL